MTVDEVYNYYGKSWARLTRELGIGACTYSYWVKRNKIPMKAQLLIQDKTHNKLKATRNEA